MTLSAFLNERYAGNERYTINPGKRSHEMLCAVELSLREDLRILSRSVCENPTMSHTHGESPRNAAMQSHDSNDLRILRRSVCENPTDMPHTRRELEKQIHERDDYKKTLGIICESEFGTRLQDTILMKTTTTTTATTTKTRRR